MRIITLPFVLFLILTLYLTTVSIPPNQLTVYRASANLHSILTDHLHSFSLVSVHTSKSQKANSSPYLFIHGHKGSEKQAIAMTKYFHTHSVDLQMYSIDFKEGAVGLSYDLLEAEANFTQMCFNEIEKRHSGQEITIIGHSFGGIVAALALSSMRMGKVKGIIALGTPFESPPINNDYKFLQAYDRIHRFLRKTKIFVVSITGGIRDLVVPAQLTNAKELGGKNSVHLYTTGMKGLHREVDHVAMVWAQEFFARLSVIVRICQHKNVNDVVKEVKTEFQSQFSAMVQSVEQKSEIFVVKVQERIGNGIEIGKDFFYFAGELETVPQSAVTQRVEVKDFGCYFYELLLGVSVSVKGALVSFFRPGLLFAEPRYPLRVRILGDGGSGAVLAKCGHEEIVKNNETDFVLYFHEYCENGPEVWILGYSEEYTLEIGVDFVAMIVCMMRDFRIHIFTAMFYLSLFRMTAHHKKWTGWVLHGGVVCVLWLQGRVLRNLTVFDFEYFKADQNINYGVIDLVFIAVAGQGLFILFDVISNAGFWVNKRLKRVGRISWVGLIVVAFYPWLGFWAMLLGYPREESVHKVVFLNFFAMLPQNVGWHIAYFTHGINGSDLLVLTPCLLLIISSLQNPNLSSEILFTTILTALFCQDHLNRVVLLLQLLSLISCFKSIALLLLTKLKPKTD